MVQKLSPYRPDQAFHEGVRQGHIRHGLDLVDLQNSEIRRPPVCLEQRIMIGTGVTRWALPVHRGVEHSAEVGVVTPPRCTSMPMRRRVNWSITTSTQWLCSTTDSQRNRSTLHRLSVAWPKNDSHEGPVPRGAGR